MSLRMAQLLRQLWEEWTTLEEQIDQVQLTIELIANQDAACLRLQKIPGVGPLTATAMVAAIGNGSAFRKGREFAAWLGLVPRASNPPGAKQHCWALASAAIPIYAAYSSTAHAPSCGLLIANATLSILG